MSKTEFGESHMKLDILDSINWIPFLRGKNY